MSSYVQGLLTGGVLVFSALIFMGQQDLELAEQRANNRFDEIVKALEIVYEQIGSASENNFVKMNDLEKKIDHMETLVVEMYNYGHNCTSLPQEFPYGLSFSQGHSFLQSCFLMRNLFAHILSLMLLRFHQTYYSPFARQALDLADP